MRKLPAIQFYPGDWRKDPAIQSLSFHERGIWFECLLFMHEAEPRGTLPYADECIARMLGASLADWQQTRSILLANGVASETADGHLSNRRMLNDEARRAAKARAGSLGGKAKAAKQKASKTEAKEGSSVSVSVSTTKNPPYPPAFETWWKCYPRRQGGNSKSAAFKKWTARIRAGVQEDDLLAGVRRYAKYIEATQKNGTEFVKQATTFLGPDEWWKEPWGYQAGEPGALRRPRL